MGKGDQRRPRSNRVSKEEYDQNFEAIFGKKTLKLWNSEADDEQTKQLQEPTEDARGGGSAAAGDRLPRSEDPSSKGLGPVKPGQGSCPDCKEILFRRIDRKGNAYSRFCDDCGYEEGLR